MSNVKRTISRNSGATSAGHPYGIVYANNSFARRVKPMKSAKKATRKKAKTAAKPAAKKAVAVRRRSVPKFTARPVKEIFATFPDCVGLTSRVAKALASQNVNILAGAGYSASGLQTMATFTLIVNDIPKAERALDKLGAHEIHETAVVLVETENKVGALERISRLIADAGINIYYFYSTTSSGRTATCIFKTADDKKAIKVLREA